MSMLSCVKYQYRSFESTYLFKVENEDKISLKILDLSQKCLFKKTFSTKEASFLDYRQLLTKGNFASLLEKLVERQLLPKEHFASNCKKVTKKPCEKVLDQTIEQFKPKVFVERKEIERLTCPLTLEIFQEPVIDEHGHTFEKSAIQAHLERKNECPISRQSISSLTPNRLVQQTIEEWQKQDPIPNFSLFKKENPKLANQNLQMAQTFIEEGEYNEALEFYTKAFQHTKNDTDYAPLPSLFEKMGDYQKGALAYLYLAKYQLQADKLSQAIQTLETCQKGKSSSLQNDLVLIELYYQNSQSKKALALSIQTAATFSKQNPEQAISLYRRILKDYPEEFSLYSNLAALLELPQEKSHVLLKGALEALQEGDYIEAERLIKKRESYPQDSFIDELISLDLIKKQGHIPQIKEQLLYLAKSFEEKKLTKQWLSAYKMLFQIEQNPEYCQKILSAYQSLKETKKELEWSLTLIALLIDTKKWEQAEALVKQTLQKAQESQKKVFLYQKLEEIYTNSNEDKLKDIWPKLGKAYQESKQMDLAEETYRKAFKRFHRFKEALALAEVLKKSGKTQESVHTYYEATVEALLEQNTQRLSLCTRKIKQIDPYLQHLDLNQRMHLLTQENILRLSQELSELKKVVDPLKEKAILEGQVKEKAIVEGQERLRQAELERKMREELSQICFGKAKWEKYFGDIGVEPPLPPNILEILSSRCIFWPNKKVRDTHLLVLVPKTVNGKEFHLDSLAELIQSPKSGHKTQYSYYHDYVKRELGTKSLESYWVLMTRDVIPESRNKTYKKQKALVQNHVQRSKIPYDLPKALEIATAILVHYVETGERLYGDSPLTYTKCQEKVKNNQWPAAIGGFSPGGLTVNGIWYIGIGGGCGVSRCV